MVRECVIAGFGIALRSTWDISEELPDERLVRVLPLYEGSRDVAVYASLHFLPTKIRVFVDYLSELFGPRPYWEE